MSARPPRARRAGWAIAVGWAWSALGALAAALPAGLFTDGMVLQRGGPVPIWGSAAPGEEVTVTFADQRKTARASAAGRWWVELDAMPAQGEPRELSISGDGPRTVLRDVVVGDVWLCSGQSNMAFRLSSAENSAAEIAVADEPATRFFVVQEQFAQQPAADVRGTWRRLSPTSAAECSAVAFYFGRTLQRALGVPVGLLISSVGGTRIETWLPRETLRALGQAERLIEKWDRVAAPEFAQIVERYREHQHYTYRVRPEEVRAARARGEPPPEERPRPAMRAHDCPSALHHGMIAPLQRFAIRGVIWYQGESNVGNAGAYPELQGGLIEEWRSVWGAQLPFLFVQLAPHRTATPAFREAQFRSWQTTPRTAMVVTTDLGDAENIHPTRKRPVGERLAAAARAVAYGENCEYSGPVLREWRAEGACARVIFDHAASGLVAQDGALRGFELAGPDGRFVPAHAEIDGETVVVSAEGIAVPTAVRYAWANVPDVNFANAAGFPAVPFRTR